MSSEPTSRKFIATFYNIYRYLRFIQKLSKQNESRSSTTLNKITHRWAKEALKILSIKLEVRGAETLLNQSTLFVGNHISYLDVPLILSAVPVTFVAKSELRKWPLIGSSCEAMDCVFVKRESKDSRKSASMAVANHVTQKQRSVVIFPSGTTSMTEEREWRRGPFQIASDHDLFVQPFRLYYTPLRDASYLLEDSFVPHIWNFLRHSEVKAYLEFHEPVKIEDPVKDCLKWWHWSRELTSKITAE